MVGQIFRVQQYNRNSLLNELLASNAKLFIGGQDMDQARSGKFITHILKGLTPPEFIQKMQEVFGADAVTHEDLRVLKLDIEKMLLHFANHIVKMTQDQNNLLFKRFVKYDLDGVFRLFQISYGKMVAGRLDQANYANILASISRVYAHFLNDLSTMPNIDSSGLFASVPYENGLSAHPIIVIKEKFIVLLNLLIMHVACEYYGDKEYFSTETVIQDSINSLRQVLMGLFNSHPYYADTYLVNKWWLSAEGNNDFEYVQLVMQQNLSDGVMLRKLKLITQVNYNGVKVFNDQIREMNAFYYDNLLELMGHLNSFEQMYCKLKENADLDQSAVDNGESVKFTILLKDHQLNALPILPSDAQQEDKV